MKNVRVRYAPSPTGHLHIGNARTAMYVYLFAKKYQGEMVLRIENTDTARNVEGGEDSQIKYLNWLGVEWNEGPDRGGKYGPYRQLDRLDIYEKYATEMIEKGFAYKCYCTSDALTIEKERQQAEGVVATSYNGRCRNLTQSEKAQFAAEGRSFTIRMRVPEGKTYAWNDLVKKEIRFESADVGDWVLVKNNGIPTYNFACVIDDHLMEISHVLRGEEHISNTPKQLMVYEALDFNAPTFGHMSIIVNENRKKLSKRDESVLQFIEQYADLGYLPEALFNFIALLGFSPEGEEEIFSKEQFCEIFDASRLSSAPAMFDVQKLEWINNRYVKAASLEKIVKLSRPHLEKNYDLSEKSAEWVEKLVALFHNQMSYGAEIVKLAELFFVEDFILNREEKEFLAQEGVKTMLEALVVNLMALVVFTGEEIKEVIKLTGKQTSTKGKLLFMPTRIATTGMMHGPELPLAIELLGKAKTIQRIKLTIENL
ncbi:glutamyl-tRNA synthetase [Erysipelotrichaceae bacterium]|nr:glutamyl-tRNA synthetase [Erysipelotrichaceae bacterium]